MPATPAALVFAWPDGSPIHPARITEWFQQHAHAAGLPVIRLHDMRHSYATAALKAGAGQSRQRMNAETANLVADMVIGSTDGSPDGLPNVLKAPPVDKSADNEPANNEP